MIIMLMAHGLRTTHQQQIYAHLAAGLQHEPEDALVVPLRVPPVVLSFNYPASAEGFQGFQRANPMVLKNHNYEPPILGQSP